MDLLAHSAGGNLALLYAARYPEPVSRLALITSPPRALGMPATPEQRLAAALLRAREPWFADVFPASESWLAGSGDFAPALQRFFYGRWDATAQAHAAAGDQQYNDQAADIFNGDGAYDPPVTRAALTTLAAPVLVLAGELDGGPSPELARHVAEFVPRGEFVVQPGAGHYPWLDDPEWFTARVGGFFAG